MFNDENSKIQQKSNNYLWKIMLSDLVIKQVREPIGFHKYIVINQRRLGF